MKRRYKLARKIWSGVKVRLASDEWTPFLNIFQWFSAQRNIFPHRLHVFIFCLLGSNALQEPRQCIRYSVVIPAGAVAEAVQEDNSWCGGRDSWPF